MATAKRQQELAAQKVAHLPAEQITCRNCGEGTARNSHIGSTLTYNRAAKLEDFRLIHKQKPQPTISNEIMNDAELVIALRSIAREFTSDADNRAILKAAQVIAGAMTDREDILKVALDGLKP